jgi:hypothetical protein
LGEELFGLAFGEGDGGGLKGVDEGYFVAAITRGLLWGLVRGSGELRAT